MPTFRPPTENIVPPTYQVRDKYAPVPKLSQRLFRHFAQGARGKTVYRSGGTWVETFSPEWSTIESADVVDLADLPGGEKTDDGRDRYLFYGGHIYNVSVTVSDALEAAGFAVLIGGYAGGYAEGY